MRIHHLNCATFCPHGGARLINGRGRLFERASLVCHCLLIETASGLVLVDSGLSVADIQHSRERVGRGFISFAKPRLDERETAIRQIEKLGFKPQDVRHILLTHLDPDHAGGIADFPEATIHVFRPEHDGAMRKKTLLERHRYKSVQWSHQPHWKLYDAAEGGDRWQGFESIRAIHDEGDREIPEILLIPLVGHTRGHCGIAVREGSGWLLHAGDAYFHHSEINPRRHRCPKGLDVFQRVMAHDNHARLENQARLRALAGTPQTGVRIFSAHDPMELYREVAFFRTP